MRTTAPPSPPKKRHHHTRHLEARKQGTHARLVVGLRGQRAALERHLCRQVNHEPGSLPGLTQDQGHNLPIDPRQETQPPGLTRDGAQTLGRHAARLGRHKPSPPAAAPTCAPHLAQSWQRAQHCHRVPGGHGVAPRLQDAELAQEGELGRQFCQRAVVEAQLLQGVQGAERRGLGEARVVRQV